MYAAILQIGHTQGLYKGKTPTGIIKDAERGQDFGCLLMMGRLQEDEAGQKELDKLEAFLKKYSQRKLTLDDIRELDIKLSIGTLKCHGAVEGDEAIAALKKDL